jgi:hypothetical protein
LFNSTPQAEVLFGPAAGTFAKDDVSKTPVRIWDSAGVLAKNYSLEPAAERSYFGRVAIRVHLC